MRKYLVLLMFIPTLIFAQSTRKRQVVIETEADYKNYFQDKVTYSDTIKTSKSHAEIQDIVSGWLVENLLSERKAKVVNNNKEKGIIECDLLDKMEIIKTGWFVYNMYLKGNLTIDYQDNLCTINFDNIYYVEPEAIEEKVELENENLISSKMVFIDKNYRTAFVKNASEQLAKKTDQKINTIFESIEKLLE
ncbi:MAG: DUF4468 domain-containing protein [Bacteroidales bacterium]|nr:DUF4468 domain-containing protein [Bacteroidales bacterium]